jgi:hypothetical protein
MLIDPSFFVQCAVAEIEQEHISVFDNLFSKTIWDVDLVVCSKYKGNDRILKLKGNHHINVLFINQNNYNTFNTKEEQFELFNKNKIEFPAQTVLNTAVYLSIFWKYKNIILIGADTSWHEDIKVDQKTNVVYSNDEHFYDSKKRILYSDTIQTIPSKLHQEFFAIAKALEYYCFLREYADYNSVSVYNASEKSWIDAFERRKLSDFS